MADGDDAQLMAAVAAGDPDALGRLYDRFAPLVLAICRRVLRDATAADDLLEEVFVEVWRYRDRYDASRGGVATYLATLTRSRAIDRLRAGRRSAAAPLASGLDPAAAPSDPAAAIAGDERRHLVATAMGALTPDQRQAVELAYFEGLTHSEIAERLGRPLGTVKTHIRQGLIRMRDVIRTEDVVP